MIGIADALREKRTKVCKAEVHGDVGRRLANNCAAPPMEACTCEDENAVVKMAMKPQSITKIPRVPKEKKKSQGAEETPSKGSSCFNFKFNLLQKCALSFKTTLNPIKLYCSIIS